MLTSNIYVSTVVKLAIAARNYGQEKLRLHTPYGQKNPCAVREAIDKTRAVFSDLLVQAIEDVETLNRLVDTYSAGVSAALKATKQTRKRKTRKVA
jgi:hypothetical protein